MVLARRRAQHVCSDSQTKLTYGVYINLKQKILSLLQENPDKAFKGSEISRRLKIDESQVEMVQEGLNQLVASGAVAKNGKKYYAKAASLTGTLSVNKAGEGFVTVEGHPDDFFVLPSRLRTGLHGDTVAIIPLARRASGRRPEAEVIRIIRRRQERFIGTLHKDKEFYWVVTDDPRMRHDIAIPVSKLHGAEVGQKVVAKIDQWEDEFKAPEGLITEVLGFPDEKGVDVLSVVKAHDIHFEFPARVMEENEKIDSMIPDAEIGRRLDFRAFQCFTIDPIDAKDFDDAVSLQIIEEGYLLGVHIADVSYYVRERSEIDKEAYKRGTSTYLVDRVIPMLPEKLSNDLCSLRPHQDRLTYSVFAQLDSHGHLIDYDIVESIIHSHHRFTYEDVQTIIDDLALEPDPGFKKNVLEMHKLSKILTQKRLNEGSIDFDTPESKFRLDDEGHPIECYRKDRLDSHRLIEEFMLLANQIVARHVGLFHSGNGKKSSYPFLYRVHDKPVQEKFENFLRLLKALGYDAHLPKHADIKPKQIQKLIERVKGKKEDLLIEKVAIRAMAKAEYSPKNLGHFGLSFDYYSHFTSPIRRYPDLIVHRMLKEYHGGMSQKRLDWWRDMLPEMGKHCSDREKVATDAERESVKVKQTEFMLQHIGQVYHGIVSGVTAFGIFVEVQEFLIEGLIHIRNLKDDHYIYDDKNYRLLGRRTKKTYRLGDEVVVRVQQVNREKSEIDFEMMD